MAKESTGIKIVIGGTGYSLSRSGGSSGYSLSGSPGYSLSGSGKGYGLAGRLDSSRIGYSSMAARGYSAGMKMNGYSIRQAYPANLFPVPYTKFADSLKEMLKLYRKKCPQCGTISANYSFN